MAKKKWLGLAAVAAAIVAFAKKLSRQGPEAGEAPQEPAPQQDR